MLKTITGGIRGRTVSRNGRGKALGREQALLQAVVKANPQFKRLDGLLTGLADACMNEAENDTHVVGVCSSIRGEGKTTIAMGLATAIARRAAAPVLLVECDLETPTLARDLNLTSEGGVAECLSASASWTDVIQKSNIEHLSIITAGEATGDPLSLLNRPEMDRFVEEIREHFQYIVFDMPPILEREDAARLVEVVDKVIFLIGAGKVSQEIVESGVTAVGKDKLMGVVLNGAWSHAPEWLARLVMADEGAPAGHA
jgi:capsular exopolysaccharide synthesis family protein